MNYYRNIEIESHANSGYMNLLTGGETSPVTCQMIDGVVMVNMTEFAEFCNREDVSLSDTEKSNLLCAIETEFAETLDC